MTELTLEEYKVAIFEDIRIIEVKIPSLKGFFISFNNRINNATTFEELEKIEEAILFRANNPLSSGGYRNLNMNAKDVKELCKANQIKLSRVVNDKRVAYTKKELITKLKRRKLL